MLFIATYGFKIYPSFEISIHEHSHETDYIYSFKSADYELITIDTGVGEKETSLKRILRKEKKRLSQIKTE